MDTNERDTVTATPRSFDGYFDRKRNERPRWNVEHDAKRNARNAGREGYEYRAFGGGNPHTLDGWYPVASVREPATALRSDS